MWPGNSHVCYRKEAIAIVFRESIGKICEICLKVPKLFHDGLIGDEGMLSRDCDGCTQLHVCNGRYQLVKKGEKVYCPDGTAHLVDESSIPQDDDMLDQH
jgi:hypothetical protein